MSRGARIFWLWTGVVLVSAAVAGVCFPKACAYVLLAQFVAGMVIGVLSLLDGPSGPDAVHVLTHGYAVNLRGA